MSEKNRKFQENVECAKQWREFDDLTEELILQRIFPVSRFFTVSVELRELPYVLTRKPRLVINTPAGFIVTCDKPDDRNITVYDAVLAMIEYCNAHEIQPASGDHMYLETFETINFGCVKTNFGS